MAAGSDRRSRFTRERSLVRSQMRPLSHPAATIVAIPVFKPDVVLTIGCPFANLMCDFE